MNPGDHDRPAAAQPDDLQSDDWGSAPDATENGPVEDWGDSEPVSVPVTVPLNETVDR